MKPFIIKTVVRTLLTLTSRERAIKQAQQHLEKYLKLADGLSLEAGMLPVEVPPMRGVDEDMRRWSFFQALEHNVIVNRFITDRIGQLVRGESPSSDTVKDPQKDVMPSAVPGAEQVEAFRDSVVEHIETVAALGKLRETRMSPHPIFGPFDAHKWNGMFSFHLGLHYPQARFVVQKAKEMVSKGD